MKKFKNVLLGLFALMLVVVPIALTGCGEVEASLEIFREFQTEYYYGEDLDLEGGMLKYTETGKEPEYIYMTDEGVTVDYFDNTIIGTNKLVITYKGETLEVEYVIKDYAKVIDKAYYYCGDNGEYQVIQLDRNNRTVTGYYSSDPEIEWDIETIDAFILFISNRALTGSTIEYDSEELVGDKYVITVRRYNDVSKEYYTENITPSHDGTTVTLSIDGTSIIQPYTLYQEQ